MKCYAETPLLVLSGFCLVTHTASSPCQPAPLGTPHGLFTLLGGKHNPTDSKPKQNKKANKKETHTYQQESWHCLQQTFSQAHNHLMYLGCKCSKGFLLGFKKKDQGKIWLPFTAISDSLPFPLDCFLIILQWNNLVQGAILAMIPINFVLLFYYY